MRRTGFKDCYGENDATADILLARFFDEDQSIAQSPHRSHMYMQQQASQDQLQQQPLLIRCQTNVKTGGLHSEHNGKKGILSLL